MKKLFVCIAALLAACLLLFVSCGKKGGGSSGGTPEITVEVFDRGSDGGKSDPTNNEWTKWIQEKVLKDENIKVNFRRVPRGDEITALNNLMAAGNPPDVCLTYSMELIGNYRDLGGLFDIAPHVDTLLPDLRKFLGPDQALPGREFIYRNRDTEKGTLYSLPSRRLNTARRNVFIRKDWLDKLGLPLPKTTEEFYQAMVAFKTKDPGNVGKANVIPFTMTTDVQWTGGNIIDSFVDPNIPQKDKWINTVIDRYFLLPGYKEGVRFMNRMFNEGLIDKDFPLYRDDVTTTNLIKNGVVGAYSHNWDHLYRADLQILSELQKSVPGADMVPVDPFTSSDGITHKGAYDPAGVNYFIPKSAKNPEAALRYINWLARYENYHFLQVGKEGVNHDIVDGIPKIKAATGGWIQNSAQNIDYTIIMNGVDLQDDEKNAKVIALSYPYPAEVVANAYTVAMTNAAPGIVIPATLSAAGPVTQTLVDKGITLLSESITASPANFNNVWDSGLNDWLKSGAQVVIDERKTKYIEP